VNKNGSSQWVRSPSRLAKKIDRFRVVGNLRKVPTTVLKISDYDGRGVLAFDLRHLLPLVATVGADLSWHVVPCGETTWFLGQLTALKTIDEFSKQVEASENGVQLTHREILELAESINQTVWGTFVGVRQETQLPALLDMFSDDCRYVDRAKSCFTKLQRLLSRQLTARIGSCSFAMPRLGSGFGRRSMILSWSRSEDDVARENPM